MNFVVRIEKRRTKILKTVAKRKVVYNSRDTISIIHMWIVVLHVMVPQP